MLAFASVEAAASDEEVTLSMMCKSWNITFNGVFYGGNVLVGIAYLLPQSLELSLLGLRALLVLGYILLSVWSLRTLCSTDVFVWHLSFIVVNGAHLLHLLWKNFPTYVPAHQREVYAKLFEPLKVTKKEFRSLLRDSTVEDLFTGKVISTENETKTTGGLRILLSGRIAAKTDDVFLHSVNPMEFLDSIEWRASLEENASDKFQVTLHVVSPCKILCLSPHVLERITASNSALFRVFRCIVSRDITKKLYALNENVISAEKDPHARSRNRTDLDTGLAGPSAASLMEVQRTHSNDAIYTGCKGFVRSKHWVESSATSHKDDGETLLLVNVSLDVPPTMTHPTTTAAVHHVDRATLAEAQFIATHKKYWPQGRI